jgi:hypothetical protein
MQKLKPVGVASDNSISTNFQEPALPFRMQESLPKYQVLLPLALEGILWTPTVKKALPSLGVRGRRSGRDSGINQGFPGAAYAQRHHLRLETRMMSA